MTKAKTKSNKTKVESSIDPNDLWQLVLTFAEITSRYERAFQSKADYGKRNHTKLKAIINSILALSEENAQESVAQLKAHGVLGDLEFLSKSRSDCATKRISPEQHEAEVREYFLDQISDRMIEQLFFHTELKNKIPDEIKGEREKIIYLLSCTVYNKTKSTLFREIQKTKSTHFRPTEDPLHLFNKFSSTLGFCSKSIDTAATDLVPRQFSSLFPPAVRKKFKMPLPEPCPACGKLDCK